MTSQSVFLLPEVEPHDDPARVIGRRTTYQGTEHPYLRDHIVIVVAVLKDALRVEDCEHLQDERAIRASGGVGPFDRVEVASWLASKGRVSFATSDPRAVDLGCFAHLADGAEREGRREGDPELIAPNRPSQRRDD